MKKTIFILMTLLFCLSQQIYAEKKPVNGDSKWGEDNDRELSVPQLYQDETYVYVYTEKRLDNLIIGITDALGNVYHQEVTTVPACTYYAISIESLPEGTYYLSVIQGSNYVIGIFKSNENL